MSPWRHRLLTWLLPGCLAILGCSPTVSRTAMPQQTDARTQGDGPAAAHCIGRFNFTLPAGWARQGQQQHIYLLKVWTSPLPAGVRVPDLLRQQAGAGAVVLREADLGSGISVINFRPAGAAEGPVLRALALRPLPSGVLLAQAETSTDRVGAAHEVISKLLPTYQAATPLGFCLEDGAVSIAPSRNERSRIAFAASGGLELSIQTETVSQPVPPPTPATEAEDARGVAMGGGKLQLLGLTERPAAGLNGWERRVQLQSAPDQAPRLIYSWISPGQPADGLNPHVLVQLKGPRSSEAALNQAWQQLLGSLARRPMRP